MYCIFFLLPGNTSVSVLMLWFKKEIIIFLIQQKELAQKSNLLVNLATLTAICFWFTKKNSLMRIICSWIELHLLRYMILIHRLVRIICLWIDLHWYCDHAMDAVNLLRATNKSNLFVNRTGLVALCFRKPFYL